MKTRTLMICSLLSGAMMFFSCKRDKIDFGMIDDLAVNPEVEAPVIKASLSLNDVIAKDSGQSLNVGADNALSIKFRQDSIFSFSVGDFVSIPTQDPLEVPLPIAPPGVPASIEFGTGFGTLGGVKLYESLMGKGFLVLQLRSNKSFPSDVAVEFSIVNAYSGNVPILHTVTLQAGNTHVIDTVDIAGSEWDFSNGGQSENYIGLSAELINNDITMTGDTVMFGLQLAGLELENTKGYFGQRHINIPQGSFNFDISGMEKLFDGFYLANPTIRLITASSVGVGLQLASDFKGVNNEGKIVALDAAPQDIASAESVDKVRYDTLEISPDNSKISEFLAALPKEVLYSGQASMNINGPSSDTNFINVNSRVDVGVEVDIPLELSLKNARLRQEITGVELFKENPDQLESLNLIFYTSNGFPLDLDVKVAFLDSATNDSIHGFDLNLLTAATIDGNGEVVQRGEPAPQTVSVSGDMLDKLKGSHNIRFTATLNTKQDGDKVEQFYTDFDLEIKMAAQAKLNLNAN